MQAHYQLVVERPIPGFGTCLEFPILYKDREAIGSLLKKSGLTPLEHYCQSTEAPQWFSTDEGRKLGHELINCIHRAPGALSDAAMLLEELSMFCEQLEVAHLSENRWHLRLGQA